MREERPIIALDFSSFDDVKIFLEHFPKGEKLYVKIGMEFFYAIGPEIVHYLRDLRHPIFALNPSVLENDETYYVYPSLITPTVPLSSQELAYSLNFPQKSIPGLPIIECTEFGRNIVSYDLSDKSEQNIRSGNIFHMNREERVSVDLSLNSLLGESSANKPA